MRCPKCKCLVDPQTKGHWFKHLDKEDPSPKDVMLAIRAWDEETLHCGGQSTLPTELRDALRQITNYYDTIRS